MRSLLLVLFIVVLVPSVQGARYHYGPYPFKGKYQPEDTAGAFGACKVAKGSACAETSGYKTEAEAQGIGCGWASPPGDGGLNPAATYSAGGNSYYFWSCNGLDSAPGACPPGQEAGYGPQGECGVPPQQGCPVGDEQRFHGDAGAPIPENICSNGCWYERTYDDVPVTFDLAGTAWTGSFKSTGNVCDLLQDETGGGGPPENCVSDSYGNTFCAGYGPDNAPPNCMQANGQQVCLDPAAPQNCGYFNGTQLCLDDYPDEGTCHFIPGGSYICFPDVETGPTSPPYPDTGTPGVPAAPDVTMEPSNETGTGPGDPLDYYTWDTVQQSSGAGGAPGLGSDTTPPQEPVAIDGPIEIDETGTPHYGQENVSLFDSIFDGIGLGEHIEGIEAMGSGLSSPMPEPPDSITGFTDVIPASGTCSDPTIQVMGHAWTIPFVSKMGGFRDIVGWAFYIWTALAIANIALSLPGKERV